MNEFLRANSNDISQAVELVGAESYVYATLRDGQAIVFRVSGRSRIAIDTELVIMASAESLHFFDSDGNGKDRRG
ncbi:ABC-type sugar transport system ATPase subunit [Rhizobium sp. BK313]|nr:ABC-type sugar transport system ATPase subunit [Rhizobium sp. BK313]